jgi:ParB family chromosome partitioning protein
LKIEITKIKVGKRIREDMGDIPELAANIQVYGLLSPIILRKISNTNYKLLAGHRRLQAAKLLKCTVIQAEIKK